MIVAIDGPAGAGKSSAARSVAEALGFAHMDTGAMYRAVTLALLDGDLDINDPTSLEAFVGSMDVGLDDNSVTVGGRDVTANLRTAEVTDRVAQVAALPDVRRALIPLQRELATRRDIVVEGRDIGTVVFPEAEVKIYLTASTAARALRRTRQLGMHEDPASLADREADIRSRDEVDATRELSPLRQASDAHRIDSTDMTLEGVVGEVVALVRRRRQGRVG